MLRKLTRMGLSEATGRGRQQAARWLERLGVSGNLSWETGVGEPGVSLPLRGHVGDPRRFFEGAVGEQTPTLLCERMELESARILAEAEDIYHGRFRLLGHDCLRFGRPVDWHLDPVSGRRAPLVHWSRLEDVNPLGGDGDVKVVWELNRHQWMVRLGQAYRLTRDERYAAVFLERLRDWMRTNPPGIGINWTSSLEVALRLISWSWALFLFRESDLLGPREVARIIRGIEVHAARVERHLSYYFSPNTHLTGEALGLLYAGLVFPELRSAGRWRELGAHILADQIERQVMPDGVYFEQSTGYQRYTAEIYLHYLILSKQNAEPVGDGVRRRVEQLIDFLLAVRRPDGSVPQIGDADGGQILPLACNGPDDYRSLFSTAAVLFNRPDYANAAGGPAPDTAWLLGSEGIEAFDNLKPALPEGSPSRLFPDGGYAVMAGGWHREAHQLILDVGPLGCPMSGAHGHADLLGLQCSIFGEPCIVDPGTYCYASEPEWRNHFRSTAAHNTLTIDGAGQAEPEDVFRWKTRPTAHLTRWTSHETHDLADAHHDAYPDEQDPIVHRRRVLFVKSDYWVVVDDVWGRHPHRLDLRYQFVPSARVEVESDPWARARLTSGRGLLVGLFSSAPIEREVHEGMTDPIRGWVSPVFGRRLPAPQLRIATEHRLPVRFISLLLPVRDASAIPPRVTPLMEPGSLLSGIVFEDTRDTIRIDSRDILVERG